MSNNIINESKKYNGWVNYETWLCNLWYDDAFTDDAQRFYDDAEARGMNSRLDVATSELTEYIEQYVADSLDNIPTSGFVADLVQSSLREVDYYEIAKAYIDEVELEESEEV